jgi:uncharacterized protein YbjT (DUF2867 family)
MEDLSHIELDPRPGHYYASVLDPEKPGRYGLLAGPFKTHQEAKDILPKAKDKAYEVNTWSAFYAFGTCRLPEDIKDPPKGVLNDLLEIKI